MKAGEIKNKLSPAQVSVMLHRVTEPPYFGKYWDHFENGTYRCAACETALFSSLDKFDSKTGWPSFKKPINERDLQFKSEAGPDDKIELRCKKCKSHLGYVIAGDAPYYRINSVCLTFEASVASAITAIGHTKQESSPSAEPNVPPSVTDTEDKHATWSFSQLAAGACIGLLIGMASMWAYLRPSNPPVQEIATSTAEMASTTSEISPLETEPTTTESQREPVLDVSTDVPPATEETAQTDSNTGTSTQ